MKITISIVVCTMFFSSYARSTLPFILTAQGITPKNIIMIIGDGMGPAYTSAYRYFHDDPNTYAVENTVFDRHLVGLSSTYPAPISGYITDSAAGATALSSGTRTYNGAIGVDTNKEPVETLLEWAKRQGKKTGIVVTSQINHATPASFLTHNESRKNYNSIADSYIDNGIKVDLILGGGWQYFIRDDRNLVNEFKQAGFHYIDNYNGLASLPKNTAVLGLFAYEGLPWALDDSNKYRLSTMTKAATTQLENDQGYFMLIEASQIDWAGHANDIAAAMAEMDDLAKTLEYLESYVEKHPNTLVMLTADHSTGGFSIAVDGKYQWLPEILRTMTASPFAIAKDLSTNKITKNRARSLLNFNVTEQEITALTTSKAATQQALNEYFTLTNIQQKKQDKPNVEEMLYQQIKKIIDQRTTTGWTTGAHTGVDVPVISFGHQSNLFKGHQTNTDIAKKIFALMGKK